MLILDILRNDFTFGWSYLAIEEVTSQDVAKQ
jgi:hypothetical protein